MSQEAASASSSLSPQHPQSGEGEVSKPSVPNGEDSGIVALIAKWRASATYFEGLHSSDPELSIGDETAAIILRECADLLAEVHRTGVLPYEPTMMERLQAALGEPPSDDAVDPHDGVTRE